MSQIVATPLWRSVRMTLTLPKWGLGSPLGLPNFQSAISGVKTPRLEVFLVPLERYWSVDVENDLAWAIQTSAAQVMFKRRAGSQTGSLTPDPGACGWNATHCWKDLKESYKFASNLISIGGLGKELWVAKVLKIQTGIVSRQFRDSHLGVPGQKAIWMWPPWNGAEYIIWGKVVASPEFGPWWVKWVQSCPWFVLAPRVLRNVNVGSSEWIAWPSS
jgi:hypothetical protein